MYNKSTICYMIYGDQYSVKHFNSYIEPFKLWCNIQPTIGALTFDP